MICTYPEIYLEDAMKNMGELIEYTAEACHEDVDEMLRMFVVSGLAERWERGDSRVICGISGTELHHRIMEACGVKRKWPKALVRYDTGSSYWSGYMLAYYQWKEAKPISEMVKAVPFSEWERLYPTLHTVSEEKAAEVIKEMFFRKD